MAKKKSADKVFTALVTKNIGLNTDGSVRVMLKEGEPITGLSYKQAQNYKSLKYIK